MKNKGFEMNFYEKIWERFYVLKKKKNSLIPILLWVTKEIEAHLLEMELATQVQILDEALGKARIHLF